MLRLAAVVVVCAALVADAWIMSPSGSRLRERVTQRLAESSEHQASLGAVAPVLVQAVVATEVERFYRHHEIDIIGVIRALPYAITHVSFAQGASTITSCTPQRADKGRLRLTRCWGDVRTLGQVQMRRVGMGKMRMG